MCFWLAPIATSLVALSAFALTDAGKPGAKGCSPIFQIERTSMTAGNKPVDYEVLSFRGDLVRFVTKLRRHPGEVAGTQALRTSER
jgi:hypothetical protein